jgi:hypothetical protein
MSALAAVASVQLCVDLHHFMIEPSQPTTWVLPFEHRCGWVLILCCSWALAEIGGFTAECLREARYGWI